MTSTFFLDTNVILYSRDLNAPLKRERARHWFKALMLSSPPVINLQVINEFCNAALRKFPYLTEAMVKADADDLRLWGDAPIDYETIEEAWRIREAFGYAWFDCVLLASAIGLNCSHFLSEDMQHGQSVNGLTIINPFLAAPGDFFET